MPQSFASLHCHIIFSTKHREPLIDDQLQPRLFEYIGGILRPRGCVLVAAGGMPDHVHLLVSLSREIAVADVVRDVKSNSSCWLHGIFAAPSACAWQAGYGAFNVSFSQIPAVRAYFAGQKEHHRVLSFKEEFVEFLERHEIEYDERYLWD